MTLNPTLWVVILGLAISATGIFVCQSAANSYIGMVSGQGKATAAGLYVAFYYLGGSIGRSHRICLVGRGVAACVAMIVSIQFLTAGLALKFWRS
ncbi:MAG: MFS transporter, partial [Synechococcales cyanobacterium CRU_2_2]|nr:MFS transporter [Synechococcales cyanobacterium CRU_2_2]